ncbi:unnamed protein product [Gordionus sp. m RMFG-2023]
MTSVYSSLTVTLTLTLRKFLSLFISIIYFSTTFTLTHSIGIGLVLTGTCLFYELFPNMTSSSKNEIAITYDGTHDNSNATLSGKKIKTH